MVYGEKKVRKPYWKSMLHPIRIGLTLGYAVADLTFWMDGMDIHYKMFSLGCTIILATITLFARCDSWDYEDIKKTDSA
jgi:hypothetical protein